MGLRSAWCALVSMPADFAYGIARVHVRPAYVMNMPLTAKLPALLSPDAQTLGSGDVGSAGGDPMSGTHIHVDAHGVVTWQIA